MKLDNYNTILIVFLLIILTYNNLLYSSEKNDYVQGIYLSAYTVNTDRFQTIIDSASQAGINSAVIDIKNMHGEVFVKGWKPEDETQFDLKGIIDLNELNRYLHSKNIDLVVRIVVFYNIYGATNNPDSTPQSINGNAWLESETKGLRWQDSSNPSVQKGLLSLIDYVAGCGVKEIQLDYVRFPTEGNLNEAIFHFEKEDNERLSSDSLYIRRTKPEIITDFVKKASEICRKHNVLLTADVFAITIWQSESDITNTGQDLKALSNHLDAIHPMIYSSHFDRNFSGRKDIWNEPYYIIYRGVKKLMSDVNPKCKIIPYIQSNNYLVKYNAEYMKSQLAVVNDTKCDGYILWNARNNYMITLEWIKEFNIELGLIKEKTVD
ncbi:MAG: putative glycoside hydrolase [Candidatus Cloacimonetes bacterium]|nr:putative glycoside hydrolase [Candidatus Cloacimonadota bacterium]